METNFPNAENSPGRMARARVMADLQALMQDSEELLRVTAGDASERAKEARARVAAALERAKATCAEWQQQGLESARAAVKKADDTIRQHPYETVGIAIGLGVLIGVLLRRK